ncbi:MAG: hypothetical protein ABSB59_34200 [Streptosporangiaceae bacterium]
MPRIDVPAGRDPLLHLWSGTGNELTGPAAAFSDAVYRKSTLPLREFEAARITIARVNDCRICLGLRPEDDPGQAFYDAALGRPRTGPVVDSRSRKRGTVNEDQGRGALGSEREMADRGH